MQPSLHIEPLPYHSESARWFLRIRHLPNAIWLDSGHPGSRYGRFDILAADPQCLLETRGEITKIFFHDCMQQESSEDPFTLLKKILPVNAIAEHESIPFVGGAMGYFAYDLGRRLEKIPTIAQNDINLPDMCIGIYPWAIIQDHQTQQAWLVINEDLSRDVSGTYEFSQIKSLLRGTNLSEPDPKQFIQENVFTISEFRNNIDPDQYQFALSEIKNYIRAGDCYQVNFAQRFSAQFKGEPLSAYLALREQLPSPYSAFMQTNHGDILCLSPERFVKVKNRRVETKPIKGTIKRGINVEEDRKNAEWLKRSEKNRAENVMIVDLLRNDLSKHCINVEVPTLCELQTFANVHHLVSTVVGEMTDQTSAIDVLCDSFPGGSITGAPKIRAMEIIEELEFTRRSIYCGSLGYISADGQMDTNIAIRTLVCKEGKVHCWGGGGIVADSETEQEYLESIAKVQVLMKTLENNFQRVNKIED